MSQQIVCKKGTCKEQGTLKHEIDSLYDDKDINDKIQKDLYNDVLSGS